MSHTTESSVAVTESKKHSSIQETLKHIDSVLEVIGMPCSEATWAFNLPQLIQTRPCDTTQELDPFNYREVPPSTSISDGWYLYTCEDTPDSDFLVICYVIDNSVYLSTTNTRLSKVLKEHFLRLWNDFNIKLVHIRNPSLPLFTRIQIERIYTMTTRPSIGRGSSSVIQVSDA